MGITTADCNDGYLQTHLNNNPLVPFDKVTDLKCVTCPTGAACANNDGSGGGVTFLGMMARQGYARVSWNASVFAKCNIPDACIGVKKKDSGGSKSVFPVYALLDDDEKKKLEKTPDLNEEKCRFGHSNTSSEICDDCESGYFKPLGGKVCEQCPEGGNNALLTALTALLAVAYACFMIADTLEGTQRIIDMDTSMPFHTIAIRIVASYMQVTSLLNSFELKLDDSDISASTVEGLGIVSTIGKQALSFDCSASSTRGLDLFLTKQTVAVTLPLMIVPVIFVVWFLIYKIKKHTENPLRSLSDDVFASLFVLYYLLFPTLVNRIAITFACTTLDDQTRITHSLSTTCWGEAHVAHI